MYPIIFSLLNLSIAGESNSAWANKLLARKLEACQEEAIMEAYSVRLEEHACNMRQNPQ